jgi:outer membrane protein TolC
MNPKITARLTNLFAVICLIATSLQQAQAQDTKSLSLEEAVQLGLNNSKQLRLNQAKIMQATAALHEAQERRLPDVSISGSYMRLNSPDVNLKINTGGSKPDTAGGAATGSSIPNVNEAEYVMANASIPLFAGFKINAGVESAKYLAKAAQLDAEGNRAEVMLNIISAYTNLYKAIEAVKLVKEDLKQAQQRVTDFGNMEQNGLLARNDFLKAQLQESNIELALLDAENNAKIAAIHMNLMLGLPEGTLIETTSDFSKSIEDVRSIADWAQTAFQHRKDAAALAYRMKAAKAGIKAAKGDYYPSLALTGGYMAANVPNVLTVTNALNAGLGLKYSPSSLWKTGSKVAQAQAQEAQLAINNEMLADQIHLQINQAYQRFESSKKKLDVYAKALEQARENYKITRNKYDNSLATATDLLEADVALLQAKINSTYGKADVVVAYNQLLQTAGILAQE